MIIRLVKLHISTDKKIEFLEIFETHKNAIRNFNGCNHLELLYDENNPEIVFTYSVWENEETIENYRVSELFNSIWSTVKPMFCGKPEAWSTTSRFKV